MERARITVFDTTLRDGEQSPGCSMNVQEKLRLAHQLDRLGVDVIEAGFPIASEGDFAAVQAIAATIRRPIIAALARACAPGHRACLAGPQGSRPAAHSCFPGHLRYSLAVQAQDLAAAVSGAGARFGSPGQIVVRRRGIFSRGRHPHRPRIPVPGLNAVVEAGATTLNIPDTVGYSMPAEFGELIQSIRQRVRGIEKVTISAHCHNDLGLAVANSLAAIAAGARQVECTINGIGERAGNASLEEIVMAMRVRPDRYPYDTGVASEQLFPASQLLSEITGVPVQPNKAIIGRNAFAHEAGIHQDGMLKNPLTYEIMTPQSVGVPDSRLVLGKHSGRHALGLRCEQLGFQFDRRELDEIYRRFVVLADKIKHVEEHHLLELIQQARGVTGRVPTLHADSAAGAGQSRFSRPLAAPPATELNIALHSRADHHADQEDYLWGV